MTKVELRAVTVRWVGVVKVARLRQKHEGNSSHAWCAIAESANARLITRGVEPVSVDSKAPVFFFQATTEHATTLGKCARAHSGLTERGGVASAETLGRQATQPPSF